MTDRLAPVERSIVRRRFSDGRKGLRFAIGTPAFLVVLGMHRSGTSCVARMLNLMGVSLGPAEAELLRSDDGEMHWEPSSLIWINDQILARTGNAWDAPGPVVRPTVRDRLRCRRFLWEFAGASLACMKDPRLCLTYPVWKRVLPQHRLVVCIRHPMNVARSHQRRDGWDLDRGLQLWQNYNQRLLEYVDGRTPAYWVDFDEGQTALDRLAASLAAAFHGLDPARAAGHYSPQAHRFREASPLPADMQHLYDRLLERCREQQAGACHPAPRTPGITTPSTI